MKWQRCVSVIVGLMLVLTANAARAAVITHGSTEITMDFVSVGNAGNTADNTGYGAVDYNYRIGTYEVTATQWATVRGADSNVGDAGNWSGSQPTAGSTWHEAAKFTNWLTTGDAEQGVYSFDDLANPTSVTIDRTYRNEGGVAYFLPSEDEWYKAAYYDGDSGMYYDYPTGSDSVPTAVTSGTSEDTAVYDQSGPADVTSAGGLSPYGTMGQGGNVWEWNETADYSSRVLRGGYWGNSYWGDDYSFYLLASDRNPYDPSYESNGVGFRVASNEVIPGSIPEPGSIVVWFGLCVTGLLWWRRRK